MHAILAVFCFSAVSLSSPPSFSCYCYWYWYWYCAWYLTGYMYATVSCSRGSCIMQTPTVCFHATCALRRAPPFLSPSCSRGLPLFAVLCTSYRFTFFFLGDKRQGDRDVNARRVIGNYVKAGMAQKALAITFLITVRRLLRGGEKLAWWMSCRSRVRAVAGVCLCGTRQWQI